MPARFEVHRIFEMIGDIGTLVASVDYDWQYIKRSFCVLELYSAVVGGCNLVMGDIALHIRGAC